MRSNGGILIFPDNEADLAPDSDLSIANIIVAELPAGRDPNDVAYPPAMPQFGATAESSEVGGVQAGTSQSGKRPSVEERIFSTFRGN